MHMCTLSANPTDKGNPNGKKKKLCCCDSHLVVTGKKQILKRSEQQQEEEEQKKRNGFFELDLRTVSALSSVSFSGNLELVYYLHGVSPARGAVLPAATINSALAVHCTHSCPEWFA